MLPMLLTMKANIEAMRALILDTSAAGDRAEHAPGDADRVAAAKRMALLTPVAKAWATDLGVELTSLGVQIHGGMGFVEETGAAQLWRDSRIAPIYEGTNGIQAIDLVMRKLPMDDGVVVVGYLEEMEATAAELVAATGLGPIGEALQRAIGDLRKTTEWLLHAAKVDALAGATPYLHQFGVVAGGCYLGRLALAARAGLAGGHDPWLRSKIEIAAFYAEQILPQAAGVGPAVSAGAERLFTIAEDLLE